MHILCGQFTAVCHRLDSQLCQFTSRLDVCTSLDREERQLRTWPLALQCVADVCRSTRGLTDRQRRSGYGPDTATAAPSDFSESRRTGTMGCGARGDAAVIPLLNVPGGVLLLYVYETLNAVWCAVLLLREPDPLRDKRP